MTLSRDSHADEIAAVRQLGDRIGYGRIMQLAAQIWAEQQPGQQFAIGPAASAVVPCTHPVLDENRHCEVCCGAGHVTKWVAENLPLFL